MTYVLYFSRERQSFPGRERSAVVLAQLELHTREITRSIPILRINTYWLFGTRDCSAIVLDCKHQELGGFGKFD